MTLAFVLGTRPEIIKLSPLVRRCVEDEIPYFVLHTNQHYSRNLDAVFFEELGLPPAKYNLNIGSGSHGSQTGRMLAGIESVLLEETPDVVVAIQGDTNTVLAGALAAAKLHVPVAHVEAGLRSFDREMPEEINRVIADHLSDFLFCPTDRQRQYLLREGIGEEKISIVGNTIVDAVRQTLKLSRAKSKILSRLQLTPKQYLLLTLHRPSNVDDRDVLSRILDGVNRVAGKHSLQVVFPIHPRTEKNIARFKAQVPECIRQIKPVGYVDMISLISSARAILSDSGGIQEEACIIGTPCVNLRENTERPEAMEVGANIMVGSQPGKIESSLDTFLPDASWSQPFGERVTEKIFDVLGFR